MSKLEEKSKEQVKKLWFENWSVSFQPGPTGLLSVNLPNGHGKKVYKFRLMELTESDSMADLFGILLSAFDQIQRDYSNPKNNLINKKSSNYAIDDAGIVDLEKL